jgi:hypothetical protein
VVVSYGEKPLTPRIARRYVGNCVRVLILAFSFGGSVLTRIRPSEWDLLAHLERITNWSEDVEQFP